MAHPHYDILLAVALSGLISFLINYLLVRHANTLRLIDSPNHRSSHSMPTPRGGGIGIVLGFSVSSFILWTVLAHSILVWIMLLLGGLIAAVGFQDDIKSSSALTRLGFQMLTVFLLMLSLQQFAPYQHVVMMPALRYVILLLAFVAGVWLINLYNFMDGINGLAVSETIFVLLAASITLFYQQINTLIFPYLLLLSSACVGFLFWNFPRAKIFMGDAGSLFLGFMIVFFAMYTVLYHQLPISCWMIWLSVFWVDATYTLCTRIFSGQRFHAAHRSHLYQILSRRLNSHVKVVALIFIYNVLWLLPLGFLSLKWSNLNVVFLLAAIAPVLISAISLGSGKNNQ